jgi:hypothetical protein
MGQSFGGNTKASIMGTARTGRDSNMSIKRCIDGQLAQKETRAESETAFNVRTALGINILIRYVLPTKHF